MKKEVNQRLIQKEKTTNTILYAGLVAFSTYTYNDTTISHISAIAKVTNGLVIQRFGSKEALYHQVLTNIILSSFPSFRNTSELFNGLLSIVDYVKNLSTGHYGLVKVQFCKNALMNFDTIPQSCKKSIKDIFVGTQLETIFEDEISQGRIKNDNGFDVFARFLINCCETTIGYSKNNAPLPSNDSYLDIFKKLNELDESKIGLNEETSVFDNISQKSLRLYNISTWYAKIYEDRDPALFFPKTVLQKAGLSEDASPEFVYKYIVEHVDPEDSQIVKEAIHKMYEGQYVEFEYKWSSPSLRTTYYRCSGKRTKVEDGVTRFEGILQNINSFVMLRNKDKTRTFYMNLLSQDYEYVSYIHLGANVDGDYVEDYKTSEFLTKITDNWENTNNFVDRFNIIMNKAMLTADCDYFLRNDLRETIIRNLKKNDRYKITFKIRHFGVIYNYEAVFFPDRGDERKFSGLICGIRLENSGTVSSIETLKESSSTSLKEKMLNDLLLENCEAAFLVNLKDHSFEVCKESNWFENRNAYVPDFEVYFESYIKRDTYYEDVSDLLKKTNLLNIKTKLAKNNYYHINYRDVSRGEIKNYIIRTTRGMNNQILFVVSNIDDEYTLVKQEKDELETLVEEKNKLLSEKDAIINNTNGSILDLLGELVESRRENGIKNYYKFKYLTYFLMEQLQKDHPELGILDDMLLPISEASVLHDLGKTSIPDSILFKEGPLTSTEFEIIKTHTTNGEKLVQKLARLYDKSYFETLVSICRDHHERYDGKGYPRGLVGDQISLPAQVVGLLDVFNALISKRPYREPYDLDTAVKMISSGQCGCFNPIILESFYNSIPAFKEYLTTGIAFENSVIQRALNKPANNIKLKTTINKETLPIIAELSEQLPGAFFIYRKDAHGSLIFFNNYLVKLFNCSTREEFIRYTNNSLRGIIHSGDFDKTMQAIDLQLENSKEQNTHIKYRVICKNGEEKILEQFGHSSNSDTLGEVCYAFVRDVTEQLNSVKEQEDYKPASAQNMNNFSNIKYLEGTRVLLVDDNDLSRFMTKDTLEEAGANVNDVDCARAAIQCIHNFKPFDIILVDLIMPDVNGVELIREIRSWEEDKDIRVPIVAITGETSSDLAKQALEEGANGCMSKPLLIPELARILILSMKEHSRKMESKLHSTIRKANTDALTHVKNRTAYAEKLEQIEAILKNNPYYEFGIVGADINNLKIANDRFGHDVGDTYIKNCCKMLCEIFVHSPVFRTGGDEFAIILEGSDLTNYKDLIKQLDALNRERSAITSYDDGKAHIARGCAIYCPETDMTIDDVIKRADADMYKNKLIEKARVKGSFRI